MSEKPDFLVRGDEARLFPILADTSKENRVASIFLAVMTQIPNLCEEILGSVGQRIGKRTKVRAFTEVVLKAHSDLGCRPDGLIVVDTGRTTWTALVEAKIGRNELSEDQVSKYVELAKLNGIDAVITISNQFTTGADHSPVNLPKTMLRKVCLHHWSWAWLATVCEIAEIQDRIEDTEQSYLLGQLNHFLAHPATGVERFTQMAPEWKDIAQAISNGDTLRKNAPEVESVVASWIAEERDLCLHMSSHIGLDVACKVERQLAGDAPLRLKEMISDMIDTNALSTTLRIPNVASDIEICADIARKTVNARMTLKAPLDKKSTKARLNWLLRMLPSDDERITIRALWPGRGAPTTGRIAALRENPDLLQAENKDLVPHGFDVIMTEVLGKRFGGRKTFVEDIERIVKEYYDLVGSNLKSWQAAPPKPVKSRSEPDPGELTNADIEETGHEAIGTVDG